MAEQIADVIFQIIVVLFLIGGLVLLASEIATIRQKKVNNRHD